MMSPIIMIELHHWAKTVLETGAIAIIPCFYRNAIHEDGSISNIIEAAQECLRAFALPGNTYHTAFDRLWHMRSKLTLLGSGMFYPCINPEWDTVMDMGTILSAAGENFLFLDNQIMQKAIQNRRIERKEADLYYQLMYLELKKFGLTETLCDTPWCQKKKAELSEEVVNFYRFML